MAPWAGLKLLDIGLNTARVLAVELMSAALAIEAQRPLRTTPELERVYASVRARVPHVPGDHRLDGEIAVLSDAILAGELSDLLPPTTTVPG
jgi:histidine ammonia-lyase